jgi:hypothetical protein
MTINATTGVISWTPIEAQLGLNAVTVEATNSEGTDTQSFDIDVAGISVLPVDDFNDNRRGAMWWLSEDDHAGSWLLEDANQLNLQAIMGEPNLVPDCVGHWKMNDDANNTTVVDSTDNGNDGTFNDLSGDPNTNAHSLGGKINNALSFDGTDDFVDIGNVIGTGAYTKTAWIKRATGPFVNNIVSADTASHAFFAPENYSFRLAAGHNGSWGLVKDSVPLAVDTWYFVAVTFDPAVESGKMVLYKNGVEVDDANNVPTQSSSTTTYIGRFLSGYYFGGVMDNVTVFDRALSTDEIETLFNNGDGRETIPAGSTSLQAFYVANGWTIDVTDDFKSKVDFHYSSISNQDGWIGINVANDNGYASISAGSDSGESYFYYEAIVDGNMVFEQELRYADDGTLYISYDVNSNNLYLSHVGYGDANAYNWQTTPNPLQGTWASESVDVAVGGGSQGIAMGTGEAYLDNFEITTATLLDWPPITDLDTDGFIDWGDLDIMSENWLEASPLFTSCVGYWKMNDNADNSIVVNRIGYNGTYHGTGGADDYTNAHHQDSGNPPNLNGALEFDGVQDYVDIGNVIGTGAYTKAAWIKRATGPFVNNIVSADTASHAFFAPENYSFKLAAGHNSSWGLVKDTVPLAVDTWYFVAVTFDPSVESGKMVLYKNGVEVADANNVPTQSSSTTTYIGRFSSGYYFGGVMDNVMVFDRALSADEIGTLYNSGSGTESLGTGAMDGDFNNDGIVDFLDYADFAWVW